MEAYKIVQKSQDKENIEYFSYLVSSPKYRLSYNIGKITTAKKGTLGIFCFKTLEDAKKYVEPVTRLTATTKLEDTSFTILRVKSFKKGIKPRKIAFFPEQRFDLFYKYMHARNRFFCSLSVPEGTVCYPAVEVIEEIK